MDNSGARVEDPERKLTSLTSSEERVCESDIISTLFCNPHVEMTYCTESMLRMILEDVN
jgi:hypothetical protein